MLSNNLHKLEFHKKIEGYFRDHVAELIEERNNENK